MNTLEYTYNGKVFAKLSSVNTATLEYTYEGLVWFIPLESNEQTFTPIITWIL